MVDGNKIIEVCSACETASCWYGEFMCMHASHAGTLKRTVSQLRKSPKEHEENWSDEKMMDIYGESDPFKTEEVNV